MVRDAPLHASYGHFVAAGGPGGRRGSAFEFSFAAVAELRAASRVAGIGAVTI